MDDCSLKYYSDVTSRKIDWLWYPYIPFGKITVIQGDPGEGKTTFVLSLLSIISNGEKLPFSDNCVSGKVIYQNTEDDNSDTIKPRLELHQADCTNICFIEKRSDSLSLDSDELAESVKRINARVLVLDPTVVVAVNGKKAQFELNEISFGAIYDCLDTIKHG